MKKAIISILLGVLLLTVMPKQIANAANTVSVTLPKFPVSLNGQQISNDYSQYPLLVYKNITYFPMTYYDCRLLGLRTTWSETEGLSIDKESNPLSEYVREVRSSQNALKQSAQIASEKISINGKKIDNSKEPYPVLQFRNVVYFPLTWRFAVEEFGWEYEFNDTTGLTILNSTQSFSSDEMWSGIRDTWGSVMGTGNLQLACMFHSDIDSESGLPIPRVSIYNMTGKDIRILPDEFQWEYQIYHTISGHDELVYRKAIPFYTGELLNEQFLSWEISDSYWKENPATGDYKCVLIHPEEYTYQILGEEEKLSTPVYDNGAYAVNFSEKVSIK